ncbi:MAG: hypothetical protein KF810_04245 [Rhizobiaceae bacterium]|nr:hypothetical protein [Rhizobiaceae bacterium]
MIALASTRLPTVQAVTFGAAVKLSGLGLVAGKADIPTRFVGPARKAAPCTFRRQSFTAPVNHRPCASRRFEVQIQVRAFAGLNSREIRGEPMRDFGLAKDRGFAGIVNLYRDGNEAVALNGLPCGRGGGQHLKYCNSKKEERSHKNASRVS